MPFSISAQMRSSIWEHTKQVLKGGSLLLAGTLGYSWVKSSWFWDDNKGNENGLISLTDKNAQLFDNNLPSTLKNTIDLNINYQLKTGTDKTNINAINKEQILAQRNLATRASSENEFRLTYNYTNLIYNDPLSRIKIVSFPQGFGVVWETNSGNIIFNRFDVNGVPLQPESIMATNQKRYPDLLYLETNKWVIAWQDYSQSGMPNYIQYLNQINYPYSVSPVPVDTGPTPPPSYQQPVLSTLGNGISYVAYATSGSSIPMRRLFDFINFQSITDNNFIFQLQVAKFTNGETMFVVNRGNGYEISGSKLDVTGSRIDGNIVSLVPINTQCNGGCLYNYPQISTLIGGNAFVICYQRQSRTLPIGEGVEVAYQVFKRAYNPPISNYDSINTVSLAHSTLGGSKSYPAIATLSSGGFVIAWQVYAIDQPGLNTVFMRPFDSNGNPYVNQYRVSQYYGDDQTNPSLTVMEDGRLLVAWKSTRPQIPGVWTRFFNTQLTATNTQQTIRYSSDNAYDLADIVLSAPQFIPTVTVTLTLSNPFAGQLSTGIAGTVASTYNQTNGVWYASGAWQQINEILSNLLFLPANNSRLRFSINVAITNGFNGPLYDQMTAEAIIPSTTGNVVSSNQATTNSMAASTATTDTQTATTHPSTAAPASSDTVTQYSTFDTSNSNRPSSSHNFPSTALITQTDRPVAADKNTDITVSVVAGSVGGIALCAGAVLGIAGLFAYKKSKKNLQVNTPDDIAIDEINSRELEPQLKHG